MAIIMTLRDMGLVIGFVTPMERPTVERDDVYSNKAYRIYSICLIRIHIVPFHSRPLHRSNKSYDKPHIPKRHDDSHGNGKA